MESPHDEAALRAFGALVVRLQFGGDLTRDETRDAYLQVMHRNAAAQALYARAGFVTTYDYHYRIKPQAE